MLGLGGRVKEAGLGSAWMLSESGDNSILQHLSNYFWYINNSYLENKRNKAKLKLYLVPKERAGIISVKIGGCLVIFAAWTNSYFCLTIDMITQWSCFCLDLSQPW